MFQDIVLAVDDVDEMEHPIEIALDLTAKYDGECHPIHVVDVPQEPSMPEHYEKESGKVEWDDVLDEVEDRCGEKIENIADRIEEMADEGGITFEGMCRIGLGDPSDTIIRFAEDIGADLIVMGIHGRKGLDKILHGSVSEDVVRDSDVPVLTVHV